MHWCLTRAVLFRQSPPKVQSQSNSSVLILFLQFPLIPLTALIPLNPLNPTIPPVLNWFCQLLWDQAILHIFLRDHWFTKDIEFSSSIYSFPSSNSLGVKLIPLNPPTQDYFSGSFKSTNPTNQTIFYNSSYTFEDSEDTKK